MTDAVLTLNAGSSSFKFSLFELAGESLARLAEGQIEGVGSAPHMTARARDGAAVDRRWTAAGLTHEDLLGELVGWAEDHLGGDRLAAVAHRVVHGGTEFAAPLRVDPEALERLERFNPLAPLHQPHNLAAIRALARLHSGLPQIACFDTAFHRGHAPEADRLGLPRRYEALGVRRYGFHGLSYEYIARRLGELDPALAAGRVIAAHLGAGASLCAMQGGRSVDTTMGFTALDGLLMATRCGALDPGVILYLLQSEGLDAAALEDLLYRRSGLLGVSEISGDMRVLLASDDPKAGEAVSLFVHRLVLEVGAMAASAGGLDGLVFTGGIGEHAAEIRRRVCERLAWLGVSLDAGANAAGGALISAPGGRPVWVIPADEEWMIARHAVDLLASVQA
jgi:acetate kinase